MKTPSENPSEASRESPAIPIQGIDHVAINVRDLQKSLYFYTEVLGLKVTTREYSKPGIEYFLDCGSSLLALIQGKEAEGTHLLQHEGIGGNHVSFRVNTQQFDPVVATLRSQNIPILHMKKREKSWSVYFLDPDGNKLEITAWPQEDETKGKPLLKNLPHAKNAAKTFALCGALFGFLAVLLGAFGGHTLKTSLAPEMAAIFEIGVRYQMYHAFALFAVAWIASSTTASTTLPSTNNPRLLKASGWAFVLGILLFSGSLYLLALTGVRIWGAITPLGGLSFLLGWLLLFGAICASKLC